MNEKAPVVFLNETGQMVELFHLDPDFVRFLDKLAGMVKSQSNGYADLFMQMREDDIQRVQVSTSYRKGHNF